MVSLRPDIALSGVTRPAAAQQRYGAQAITRVTDSVSKYQFEDSLLAIKFLALGDGVYFDLENKTSFPLQIDWTQAAFVDPKGKSQAIMHAGMKYDDCIARKAPSIIVAHTKLTDEIIPCDYVSRGQSGWSVDRYFEVGDGSVLSDAAPMIADSLARALKGQTISVLLPIKTQDVVNDYTFTFEFLGVQVLKRR